MASTFEGLADGFTLIRSHIAQPGSDVGFFIWKIKSGFVESRLHFLVGVVVLLDLVEAGCLENATDLVRVFDISGLELDRGAHELDCNGVSHDWFVINWI